MDRKELDTDVKRLAETVDAFNAELLAFVRKYRYDMDVTAYVQHPTDDPEDQVLRVQASELYADLGQRPDPETD